MPLMCSYCHKEITEAPIAAIHLGCAPKVMELATTDSPKLPLEEIIEHVKLLGRTYSPYVSWTVRDAFNGALTDIEWQLRAGT